MFALIHIHMFGGILIDGNTKLVIHFFFQNLSTNKIKLTLNRLDWMALNGINLVYAQTAAEFAWLKVYQKMGFTFKEINDFFTGPAYLA